MNLDPVWLSALVKIPLVLAFPVLAWLLGCVDLDRSGWVRRLRES